jgi:hypothetical protein
MATNNPVVEIFQGIEIRRFNRIAFKVDAKTMKEILLAQFKSGLSVRKILGHSSKPCNRCEGTEIIAYNREGDEVKIPRGILSKRIPETHCGNTKIEHNESSH